MRTRLRIKFPANREINREFCRIRQPAVIFVSDRRADSMACSRIPYASEQGISKRVSGKIFEETGYRYADIRRRSAWNLNRDLKHARRVGGCPLSVQVFRQP
jgi:hypothetical protein